jgi:hypothetical protein
MAWIERWNGAAWSQFALQCWNGSAVVGGVSCFQLTSCIVAGGIEADGPVPPVVLQLGRSRITDISPDEQTNDPVDALSCWTLTSCVALDGSLTAMRWSQGLWTDEPLPSTLYPPYGPDAISCISATACVAVGSDPMGLGGPNAISAVLK